MCNCSKDQTQAEWIKKAGLIDLRDARGTGVFLVPAPEIGILEVRKVYVAALTYADTARRGENCIAYQWVPESIASGEALTNVACGQFCNFQGGTCPPGCFCGPGNYCR